MLDTWRNNSSCALSERPHPPTLTAKGQMCVESSYNQLQYLTALAQSWSEMHRQMFFKQSTIGWENCQTVRAQVTKVLPTLGFPIFKNFKKLQRVVFTEQKYRWAPHFNHRDNISTTVLPCCFHSDLQIWFRAQIHCKYLWWFNVKENVLFSEDVLSQWGQNLNCLLGLGRGYLLSKGSRKCKNY